MIESPIIAKLLSNERVTSQAKSLLRVMRKRYGEIPEAVTTAIRACTNGATLDYWLDAVAEAQTLTVFRQVTGL